jgi:hypothetical protein
LATNSFLGKRVGTPTGKAASGFVEEYDRMEARANSGEDVAVWIYTLELTAEDLADPGDKLKAVLAFREWLFREALVKEVRNVDDFAAQLYRDLVSLVLEADERRQQSTESVSPPKAEMARPVPRQEPSDEAGRRLHELLTDAAAVAPLLPESFHRDRLPLARLSTWEGWYFTRFTELHGLIELVPSRSSPRLEERQTLRVFSAVWAGS